MRLSASLLVVLSLSLVPVLADAHLLWAFADPVKKTVRLEIAEKPGEDIAPILGKLAGSIESPGMGPLKADTDNAHITAPLKGGSAAFRLTYGLHGDDLVTWWAKATTNVAEAGKTTGQAYEITLRRSGASVIAKVFRGGKAVPGAAIGAFGEGLRGHEVKTDQNGEATFPIPTKGTFAVGARIIELGAGTYKGQTYKQKMELITVTVPSIR